MANINKPVAVSYLSHPLTSQHATHMDVESGVTIERILQNINIHHQEFDDIMVWINGEPVTDWQTQFVYHGDIVNIRPVVKGDNVGGILATIATIVISVYFPPAAAALGMGTLGAAVATGVLVYGATMLIQRLFPPPEPQQIERKESYLIASSRNRVRLFEPLSLVIGKLRVAPDVASATFGRFENNEQIVHQVYHFGLQPGLTLEDWRIGDTPITQFQTPPTIVNANAAGELPKEFHDVEVIQGGELKKSVGAFVATTQPGSIGVEIDLQVVAYHVDGKGRVQNRDVDVQIRVYEAKSGHEVDSIDKVYSGNSVNENRISVASKALPKGQYRVEITKMTNDQSSTKDQNKLIVVAIKSTQQDDTDYQYQKRVGITMQATNQINGAIKQLTALAYDAIPVYENKTWTVKPTDNPAWWMLWFARGKRDKSGKLLYGGGLNDVQIDIDSIIEFGAWCERKKLTCGFYLNKQSTVKKVLDTIARCGRGESTWGTGKLGVIWDEDKATATAVFSPSNIRLDSFKIHYDSVKTADEIIINFLNKDNDYKPDSVRVNVGDTTSPSRPSQFQFEGCLDADMAGREARLLAAAQEHLRRTVTWETDIEGVTVRRGDVVLLSHDIVGWSQSGRVVAKSDRKSFYIDRDITVKSTGHFGLRMPNGKYQTFKILSATNRKVVLAKEPAATFLMPGDDTRPVHDWLWFYDEGGEPGRPLKVKDVTVKDQNTLAFTAKDYTGDYYNAESGNFVHISKPVTLKPYGDLITGVLAWETFRIDDDIRTHVLALSWASIPSVEQYTVRIWNDKAGGEQSIVTETSGARFDVKPGIYNYRISGVDLLTSQTYTAVGRITITGAASVDQVKSFTAQGILGGIVLNWEYPDNAINMRLVKITATYTVGSAAATTENFRVLFPTDTLTHMGLGVGQSVSYELVLVDSEGNESSPTTVTGMSSDDIQALIDSVTLQIDESALAQTLRERINKIGDVETQLAAVKSEADQNKDELAAAIKAEARANEQIKTDVKQLIAAAGVKTFHQMNEPTGSGLKAGDLWFKEDKDGNVIQTLRYDGTTWTGSTTGDAVANAAAILREQNVRAAADTSLGNRIDKVVADTAANKAAITSQATAYTTADKALGQRIDTISTTAGQNKANITKEATARAAGDKANATSITQLQATFNNKTATIEQSMTTTNSRVNGLRAQYTVKVDNNGYVSGFGLASTAKNGTPTSAFGIRADKFFIAAPTHANVDAKNNNYPFIVKDGKVYMRNAIIENGSISSAKIANRIQSTNYKAGSRGWRIDKNGHAEFNSDVVVNASVAAQHIVGDIVSSITKNITPRTSTASVSNGTWVDILSVGIKHTRPYSRFLTLRNVDAQYITAQLAVAASGRATLGTVEWRLINKSNGKVYWTQSNSQNWSGTGQVWSQSSVYQPAATIAANDGIRTMTLQLRSVNYNLIQARVGYNHSERRNFTERFIAQLFKDSGELS